MALRPEIKLMPHQVGGVKFMLKHNYSLCGDEQGLGKTLEAIAVQQASGLDCLVICPATLKYNWKEEYEKFTDETDVRVGTKKAKINIVNYENIYKCTELFMKAKMVIIDEAHYLIHMDSQRTTYAHRMIEKYNPERCLLLTGTPIKNRVSDFYSILRILSYTPVNNNGRKITDKFDTQTKFNNYFMYKQTFKVRVKTKRGGSFMKTITKYSGCKNEDVLKKYMNFKYIRRVAAKVLDLPPFIIKEVPVSYKANPELEREWIKFNKGEGFDSKIKATAALATANYTADYTKDILDSGEGPVVIFSDHIDPLYFIESRLKKKFKVAVITGKTKLISRKDSITSFQNGELDAILISSAAAAGVNLHRSRNLILNDEPWDVSTYSQVIKRIHRIGQKYSCVIHKMLGSKTSKKISKSNRAKEKDINKII